MASLNKVFLMGNMTRDPEIRHTESGTAITRFGLAVNRRVRDQATDQWRDEVDFIDIVMFGRRGEVVSEYLRKGSPIFVEGRLNFNSWETPNGERRNKLEVVGENFEFIGSRSSGSETGGQSSSSGSSPSQSSGQSQQQDAPSQQDAPPSYNESGFADDDVPF